MDKHVLTILAFVLVTFSVQGLSHFVINADHYASIGFLRADTIMPLGFATMIIQALVLSLAMSKLWPDGASIKHGLVMSACFGLFLASYIVLAEPAKYAVPSIPAWMMIEAVASAIQFGVFGVLLGLIYRRKSLA